jgi:hypothetical protein
MIHCGLLEHHYAYKEYADMATLFEHACKVEHDVQGRRSKQYSNSFAGQISTSISALALLVPSTPTTTVLESPVPSTPTTTLLQRMTEPAGAYSFVNLEPSLHNAPNTPTENICNAHGATHRK